MQPEEIVLFPPTDEQTLPTFHVPVALRDAFLAHLERRGIKVTQPPEALGKLGPEHAERLQVEVDFAADPAELKAVLADFRSQQGVDADA